MIRLIIGFIGNGLAYIMPAGAAKWAARGLVVLIPLLLIALAFWWFNDTVDDARDEGVKAGVTTERVEAQGKVIENVRIAKDAADDVRRNGVPAADCLRDSRTPENC